MKNIILFCTLSLYGAILVQGEEKPTVNIPSELRQGNWIGRQGEGSCVHASFISLLRWQGRYNTANYWRNHYGNGECPGHFASLLNRNNIRFAYVTNGDVKFLEWACRTRRGCAITVLRGKHVVTLVHFDEDDYDDTTQEYAAILDNNNPTRYIWMPRDTLISEWRSSYGWAVTPVYSPAAPLPNSKRFFHFQER